MRASIGRELKAGECQLREVRAVGALPANKAIARTDTEFEVLPSAWLQQQEGKGKDQEGSEKQ